jgi:hypothetical protein
MRRAFPAAALLLLAACAEREEAAPPAAVAPGDTLPAPREALREAGWASNPVEGVTLRPGGIFTAETGPHTILWPTEAAPLEPPYTVRATLVKHSGRIHEGYGVVFGGSALEGTEEGQRYGYFLVRGDGSYLVKLREGAETPVVVDWTRHPRIHRENGGPPRPNELEVRVGADTTAFLVNGVEVARASSAELPTAGRAGVRVAHDVVVELRAFEAAPGPADGDGS